MAVTKIIEVVGSSRESSDQAVKDALEDARRLEPENFVIHGLIGDLETRAGREAAALRAYRRALELNPGDVGLQQLARQKP